MSVVDATEVRDHPIVRYCDGLGGQAYLIQEKVGTDTGKIRIAVMWTVNTLATFNEVDVPAASNSALRALRNAQEVLSSKTRLSVQLSGLVLTNHQGTNPSQEALHYEQNDVAISYIDIGSDESCWSGAVQLIAERLESWF